MLIATERKKIRGTKMRWYVSGPLFGCVIIIILMYVVSLLVEGGTLPCGILDYMVIACVFLGSIVAGVTSAIQRGRGVIETGMAAGGIIFIAILLATLVIPNGKFIPIMLLKLSIAAIAGGAFGGSVCAKRSGSTKKRSRRRR